MRLSRLYRVRCNSVQFLSGKCFFLTVLVYLNKASCWQEGRILLVLQGWVKKRCGGFLRGVLVAVLKSVERWSLLLWRLSRS